MAAIPGKRRFAALQAAKHSEGCVGQRKRCDEKWEEYVLGRRICGAEEIEREERDRKTERGAARIIRNYLFRVFDKLGVSTRVELVLYCLQERQKEAAR